MDFIASRFLLNEGPVNKVNKETIEWENIFAISKTNKRLLVSSY